MLTRAPSTPVVMGLASLAPLHAVMCGPALPGIKTAFEVTPHASQQAISVFMLGYALSQLLFGPPANAFGRVKTLLVGLTVGTAGSLLVALSGHWGSFGLLLLGRFIAGVGTASSVVVSYAIAHDVFEGKALRRVLGWCFAANAALPALGTLAAGFLSARLGWASVFYVLAAYTVLVALSALSLPETLPVSERTTLRFGSALNAYGRAFKNSALVVSGFQFGLALSILYGTVALMPFLAVHRLDMSVSAFGTVFFVSYLGYLAGSLFCIGTAGRTSPQKSVLIGIGTVLVGAVGFGLQGIANELSVVGVFGCVFVMYVGFPIIFSNSSGLGISSHDDKGNGSGAYAFIYAMCACVSLVIAGAIHDDYAFVIPVWAVAAMLSALILHFTFTVPAQRRGAASN